MVDWSVPKTNKEKLEPMVSQVKDEQELSREKVMSIPNAFQKSNWTNEYPTEFGMTAFKKDKILGVTDTSKSILVHMINGHTYTITIKESIIPFFNRDGITTADVLEDLKSD
tara:strand:- start:12814 stop:13149 length:336 start_codon:yes stop_codon:yes gene_type:complete